MCGLLRMRSRPLRVTTRVSLRRSLVEPVLLSPSSSGQISTAAPDPNQKCPRSGGQYCPVLPAVAGLGFRPRHNPVSAQNRHAHRWRVGYGSLAESS